ncbi:MAG: SPOR domain-containing protein [Chlorobi bacterium]|nr:SPOR domain-containing protein [Chlorobiota bacterium]
MPKSHFNFLFLTFLFSVFCINIITAQEGIVSINQDKNIDVLLNLKKEVNKSQSNYKIQIYNGNRSGAKKARLEFKNSFSNWSTYMKFETPNYKIWIGNFKTRIEADRALLKIKRKFNNAFIFKPKKEKRNLK